MPAHNGWPMECNQTFHQAVQVYTEIGLPSTFRVLLLGVSALASALWSQPIAHLLLPSPVEVSGVALDSSGAPLQGVRVEHATTSWPSSEGTVVSDANGRFGLRTSAPAVVLRRDGYESVLLRITTAAQDLRVQFLRATNSTFPTCQSRSCAIRFWGGLCLTKVKGVGVRSNGLTLDTSEQVFTAGSAEMIHGSGTSWGGPEPRDHDVWSSVEYVEQIREGPGFIVLDARGKAPNGKLWRSWGLSGESFLYFDLPPDKASKFDSVLDGACVAVRPAQ